jgi:hypothetical protein
MSQRVSNKTGTRTHGKTLCVGGIVMSIAAFQADEPGSIPGRCSFVLQVLKTESYYEFESSLVTNSLALCNCFHLADKQGERWQLLVRNVMHYVPVLLPKPHLVVHNVFHYVPLPHPPPHQPFFRTFKKSTAPYKVHNMRLRYIKIRKTLISAVLWLLYDFLPVPMFRIWIPRIRTFLYWASRIPLDRGTDPRIRIRNKTDPQHWPKGFYGY